MLKLQRSNTCGGKVKKMIRIRTSSKPFGTQGSRWEMIPENLDGGGVNGRGSGDVRLSFYPYDLGG